MDDGKRKYRNTDTFFSIGKVQDAFLTSNLISFQWKLTHTHWPLFRQALPTTHGATAVWFLLQVSNVFRVQSRKKKLATRKIIFFALSLPPLPEPDGRTSDGHCLSISATATTNLARGHRFPQNDPEDSDAQ